jgi:hypothetical protein
MASTRRFDEKISGNVSIFLTVRCRKAYQTFGVNFYRCPRLANLSLGLAGYDQWWA